jgi:hypothetical protein
MTALGSKLPLAARPHRWALGRHLTPVQRTFQWKVRWAVARVCQARWQGVIRWRRGWEIRPRLAGRARTRLPRGEGRPGDLPVADRQARTHRAQARGRVAGAGGFDAGQIRQEEVGQVLFLLGGTRGIGFCRGGVGWASPARSADLPVEGPPGRCQSAQARWQGGIRLRRG